MNNFEVPQLTTEAFAQYSQQLSIELCDTRLQLSGNQDSIVQGELRVDGMPMEPPVPYDPYTTLHLLSYSVGLVVSRQLLFANLFPAIPYADQDIEKVGYTVTSSIGVIRKRLRVGVIDELISIDTVPNVGYRLTDRLTNPDLSTG